MINTVWMDIFIMPHTGREKTKNSIWYNHTNSVHLKNIFHDKKFKKTSNRDKTIITACITKRSILKL